MSRSCSNWIEVANGNQDICLPIQRRWEAEETQPTLPDSLSLFEILQRQPIIPRSNGIIRIRIPNAQVTLPLNSFPYQCHLFLCHLNLLRLLFPLLPSHLIRNTTTAVHLFDGRKEDMVRSQRSGTAQKPHRGLREILIITPYLGPTGDERDRSLTERLNPSDWPRAGFLCS